VIAEVVESKPIICDGAVRHRLLMRCSGRVADAPNNINRRSR
jgi:hypothetical protein